MKYILIVLIFSLPAKSEPLLSEQSFDEANSRPHHFFNAELLEPDEKQISILGSIKVGVNEYLELGTQGLFILGGAYNLYLKHLMFEKQSWRTAFVSHTFYISNSTSEIDENTLEEKKGKSDIWLSAVGIITTHSVTQNMQVSWGLYDLYLSNYQTIENLDVQGHFISPAVAVDYYLSHHWFFTGSIAYATFISFNIESDIGDASVDANLFEQDALGIDPTLGFLTLTYSSNSFNTEFGFVKVPGTFLPYLNLFWRFE